MNLDKRKRSTAKRATTSLVVLWTILIVSPGLTGSKVRANVPTPGDEAPPWLRSAAAVSVPAYPKDVPAVILWDESVVNVEQDGRMTRNNFYAVKVLNREGREEAYAREVYNVDSEKVKEMRAWLISPSGKVKKYGKGETAEVALAENDVYNEARKMIIVASGDAEPGSVFGYETVTEDKSVFGQVAWYFQGRPLPVIKSRISITVPQGWTADGLTLNHSQIEPTVASNTYSWELTDLPPVEEEPMSPPPTSIVPWIAINLIQSNDKPGVAAKRAFTTWADVSKWLTDLSDSQAVLDDALAGKAKTLTASCQTELEKIAAIGRHAQAINYVSIQIGVGRGGGYRPHLATEVFAKSYGDCKDKANLMRAMLKAVGIQSYLVSINSGDPTYVRKEWPSPQQFNHCIIAVKVSDETQAPTIINHPTLGRLLIFDPTDDNTPVGDLPSYEQGSYALIEAGEAGALVQMPVTPPESNLLSRNGEVSIQPDGGITANLTEQSVGQAAVRERGAYRGLPKQEYLKEIERWVSRGATGAIVSKVEPVDDRQKGQFSLHVEFAAPHYAQLMQERLLVFKPAIVSRREQLALTGATRKHPIVLRPRAFTETIAFRIPNGFEVDETPDPLKLQAAFGNYETSYVTKAGQLLFTRKLVVRASTVQPSDYAKVRGFFEKIGAAEQAPVVLAKK
jgi:hypothetical protein